MKQANRLILLLLTLVAVAPITVNAQDAAKLMEKSHLAYYYAGDDGVGEVLLKIVDKRGKERVKQFTMLRLDLEEGGRQKYYTYFKKPSDIARLTFMVHKSPEGSDSRWIYIPSVDLIKPISADDKNSSFVGSDFSYEDVSGRHWNEDDHKIVKDSTVDSNDVTVVESVPKSSYKGFARKLSYIDKTNLLPLLELYFDKKEKLIRVFRAENIEEVDGIMTITARSMENVKKKRKTSIEFSSIKYNQGLTDDIFTERFLKTPPRKFIK